MYLDLFQQMRKQLAQISTWLDAAKGYAETRKFDPDTLVTFRLAPDQFAFVRQIQIACDTLKLGASRLTGKDAPKHADDEKTLAELQARVRSVLDYLDGFTAADFADTAGRSITQPRWEGKTMTGHDYCLQHVLPNFYFHAAHTYAILRHNGVPLGKKDYLGALTMKAP